MDIYRTKVVNIKHPSSNVAGSENFFTRYIGRGTKWGNNYRLGLDGSREVVIAKHKADFIENTELQEAVWNELAGQVLGCSCKPEACHGDTYVTYIKLRIKNNGKPMNQWEQEDIDEFCKKD